MQIEGVRVVPVMDGKAGPAIDFTDAVDFQVLPSGALLIMTTMPDLDEQGQVAKRAYPAKCFSPHSWYTAELLDPKASKLVIAAPQGKKLHA